VSSRDLADIDVATEVALGTSRIFVGIALRSLGSAEITLPQYRALVLLDDRGEQNVGDFAEHLAIHPSTATRLCDRLHTSGLIERATSTRSRREVTIGLSPKGRALVRRVTKRRREELRGIVSSLSAAERTALVTAFAAFATAAGETPDDAWKLGWSA